jgi:polysaccharide pyruvyl transferase WcaK-like protein
MNRRDWVKKSGVISVGALFASQFGNATESQQKPRILLVSGWQTVNIGDIAHTPGMIHLLHTYLPQAIVTLWPNDISLTEEAMLKRNFPFLKIVFGKLNEQGLPGSAEVAEAFETNDFMLHGSGPGIVGQAKLEAWRKAAGKPYGFFGVTIENINPKLKELLDGASFIFTRETASLKVLNRAGITKPAIDFAPDATFFMPIRNDVSTADFMKTRKLEERKFICVAPRSRFTPYHRIHANNNWNFEKIQQVINDNDQYAEKDHEKFRQVIIRWVTETGNKVVLVPEMQYQTELFEPFLYNPLPENIKRKVEMHPYWQPDEAASLYSKASAVISMECHSPIISLVSGTPAIYVRQPSDTIKGQMYYDLELSDWIFEIEDTSGEQIADRLLEIHQSYPVSLNKVEQLNQRVKIIYNQQMKEFSKIPWNRI